MKFNSSSSEDAIIIFGVESHWIYIDGSKGKSNSRDFKIIFSRFSTEKKKFVRGFNFITTIYREEPDLKIGNMNYFVRKVPAGDYAIFSLESAVVGGSSYPMLNSTKLIRAGKGEILYMGNLSIEDDVARKSYTITETQSLKDARIVLSQYKGIEGDMELRPFKTHSVKCDFPNKMPTTIIYSQDMREYCTISSP